MTVAELKHVLAQCKSESEVLIRLDDEFVDDPQGNVAVILGHEYSYGCTETLALMLECGQPRSVAPSERGNVMQRKVNGSHVSGGS